MEPKKKQKILEEIDSAKMGLRVKHPPANHSGCTFHLCYPEGFEKYGLQIPKSLVEKARSARKEFFTILLDIKREVVPGINTIYEEISGDSIENLFYDSYPPFFVDGHEVYCNTLDYESRQKARVRERELLTTKYKGREGVWKEHCNEILREYLSFLKGELQEKES